MLGGISGYDVTETTDEDPNRVGLIQKVTLGYLQRELLGKQRELVCRHGGAGARGTAVGKLEEKGA